MKKILCLILIIITLISFIISNKIEELSNTKIKDILISNDFLVNDLSSKMEDDSIKIVYVANNGKYSIEYYLFDNKENAKEAFNGNIKTFNDNKIKGNIKNKDNYDSYTQELSDTYNSITRIGKNLIYASINIEYKDEFNKILKKLSGNNLIFNLAFFI